MKHDNADLSTTPSIGNDGGAASTASAASAEEPLHADPLQRSASTLVHGASFEDTTNDGLVAKADGSGVAAPIHNLPDVALIIEKSWCHKILFQNKTWELRSRPNFG